MGSLSPRFFPGIRELWVCVCVGVCVWRRGEGSGGDEVCVCVVLRVGLLFVSLRPGLGIITVYDDMG